MGLLYAYSCLPPFKFQDRLPISSRSLYQIFSLNLSANQYKQIEALRRIIDIKNLLTKKLYDRFDEKGNFSLQEFKDKFAKEKMKQYMLDFLQECKDDQDLISKYPKLYADFFEEESKESVLVAKVLKFEKEVNVLLFCLQAKKNKISIDDFLGYMDLSDPLIEYAVIQSKGEGPFHFPYEYKNLEALILDSGMDPMKQYDAVNEFKFRFYDELALDTQDLFTKICAYMMQVWINEDKSQLDEASGRELLTKLLENEDE